MISDFQDLLGYKKRKLYQVTKRRKNNRKNLGYQYGSNLLKNGLSPHILRNSVINDFITLITDYLLNIINNIKKLEKYKNFTVDKDNTDV